MLTSKSLFFEEEKLNAKASFLPQRHRDTEVQEVSSFGSESHLRFRTAARSTVELVTPLLLATSVTETNPSSQRRPRCTGASFVSVHSNPSVSDDDSGKITRPQNARVLPNSVPLCLCASVAKKEAQKDTPGGGRSRQGIRLRLCCAVLLLQADLGFYHSAVACSSGDDVAVVQAGLHTENGMRSRVCSQPSPRHSLHQPKKSSPRPAHRSQLLSLGASRTTSPPRCASSGERTMSRCAGRRCGSRTELPERGEGFFEPPCPSLSGSSRPWATGPHRTPGVDSGPTTPRTLSGLRGSGRCRRGCRYRDELP